ncbi:Piso0_003987 [Millerozyma farinosa CBS 7064]|uniref:Piso0_003987 protein n=1 Tax=Pichia sorbitophila (strain ATCC MYA-4447 / BCRC 22081 / CBS 7064 / NBRC 10061 / NRRL Y-12695) TaxID=559304 RepID=G8YA29_PICSO|nr:Piso0_003987 [Millerozyma farinosa CBS 7064]CCE84443.1 Piso0_003987 [Millerozyma farinosa CBS 7064]
MVSILYDADRNIGNDLEEVEESVDDNNEELVLSGVEDMYNENEGEEEEITWEEPNTKTDIHSVIDTISEDEIDNLEEELNEYGDKQIDRRIDEAEQTEGRENNQKVNEKQEKEDDTNGLLSGIEGETYFFDSEDELEQAENDSAASAEPHIEEEVDITSESKDALAPNASMSSNTSEYKTEEIVVISSSEDEHGESPQKPQNVQEHASASDDIEIDFPIIVKIADTDFLLVPFRSSNDEIDVSHLVSLYDDQNVLNSSLESFFVSMRNHEDLNEICSFDASRELVLTVPELGNITITEDNIYSREVSVNDFVDRFHDFKLNSKLHDSELLFQTLSFKLSFQTRFISEFNNLSKLLREDCGFKRLLEERRIIKGKSRTSTEAESQDFGEDIGVYKRAKIGL